MWRARVGVGGGRGSELVEYRIRSEHFRLAGSMFLSSPPCVCGAGMGEGGRSRLGGGMLVACVLVRGVLWPFISGVSRGLAANAYSSLRYYGIDTRAAASRPEKGGGRRWRSAPRPFGRFGLHAQPSCTASGVIDRGCACGAGAAMEERRRLSRAARRTSWGRRGRASGDWPKQPHAAPRRL